MIQPPSLENPTIQITDIALTDEGNYICEYAAYPTGNEKGVTSLIILGEQTEGDGGVCVFALKSLCCVPCPKGCYWISASYCLINQTTVNV